MPGDAFSDFAQQLPAALLLNMCIPGILLIGVLLYFYYIKPQRSTTSSSKTQDTTTHYDYAPPVAENHEDQVPGVSDLEVDTGDLPDLGMLLDTSAMIDERPPEPITTRRRTDGTYSVKLHTGGQIEVVEVMAVLRDTSDDRLVVQMGGTAYRSLVDKPDLKQQFIQIMRQLSEVVAQPDDISLAVDDSEQIEAKAAEEAIPSVSELLQSEPPPISIPPPPTTRDGSMPGDLPSFKLDDTRPPEPKKRRLFGRRKVEHQPIPEINIGEAIEAYLQHKLRYTPEFNRRRIHVHPAPGGGVAIEVDGQFYEAVSDIEDAEVRAFLATTIQEWQERQSRD